MTFLHHCDAVAPACGPAGRDRSRLRCKGCSGGRGGALTPGGTYDEATRLTVEAFQRHWRPGQVDGVADGETRATLMGVLQLATAESVTGVLN